MCGLLGIHGDGFFAEYGFACDDCFLGPVLMDVIGLCDVDCLDFWVVDGLLVCCGVNWGL